MRTKKFNVSEKAVIEFANELTKRKMMNTIAETNKNHLIIEVEYHKGEASDIYELEELLDDINEKEENS